LQFNEVSTASGVAPFLASEAYDFYPIYGANGTPFNMIMKIIIKDIKFSMNFAFRNQEKKKYYNSLIICGQKSSCCRLNTGYGVCHFYSWQYKAIYQ